jgi:hypothetical protein
MAQRGCVDRAERVARAQLTASAYETEHARGRAEAHSVVAALASRQSS